MLLRALIFAIDSLTRPFGALPAGAVDGWAATLRGETFGYHSAHPTSRASLLVRSLDSTNAARWVTAPVPPVAGATRHVVFLAAMDLPAKQWDGAVAAVAAFQQAAKAELTTVEPGLAIKLEAKKGVRRGKVLKRALQQKLSRTIAALPHGVLKMSADIPGLVETSTNVAAIKTTSKDVVITTSQRSSVESEKDEACLTVRTIFELGGATVRGSDGYPGWKPTLDSPILKLAQSTYKAMFGKEPAIKAIHAGLECGIIGERYPGMDMVSFGPTLREVHSPNERIHLDTVPRFFEFLLGILGAVQ